MALSFLPETDTIIIGTSIVQLGPCDFYLFYHSIYLIDSMGHLIDMYLGHIIFVPKIQINHLRNNNSISKSMFLKHFFNFGILSYSHFHIEQLMDSKGHNKTKHKF